MDRKCAFRGLPRQGSVLTLYSGPEGKMSHKGLQNLWQPDTHFLNAKSASKGGFQSIYDVRTEGRVQKYPKFAEKQTINFEDGRDIQCKDSR